MNLWTSSAARTQPSVERIFRPADATAPFPYQEAYKTLRTNLKFMALGGDYRRILVTGAIQRAAFLRTWRWCWRKPKIECC